MLINLGTPDSPDVAAVRDYLQAFLADPEVIRLPRGMGWMNPLLARLIAEFRAKSSSEKYRRIWNGRGSPLRTISEQQATALADQLPNGVPVFSAMRHGRPSIAEAVEATQAQGIEELVVIPMYPQYSGTTTRTTVRELYRCVHRAGCRIDVTVRGIWYDDSGYVNAQARLLHEYATAKGLTPENTHLLFSAHSLPVSYVKRGDPYAEQITKTAELVARRLGWPVERATLGFQSRLGPVKWMGPSTVEVLAKLAEAGENRVLVCPLSFTTDCLETLEEVGIRYRGQFEQDGRRLHLCPSLNSFEPFIAALKNLVTHGRHPMTVAEAGANPLMGGSRKVKKSKSQNANPLMVGRASLPAEAKAASEEASIDSLVMIGMSLSPRLGGGRGPDLACTEAELFRRAKRSQCEVPDVLRSITADDDLREALLWNTCRRFELYAWLKDPRDDAERGRIIDRLRGRLFQNDGAEAATVNVLCGADAWQHLIRTAAGLNSMLPGERDVVGQLQAAHRLAERAGTAGPLTENLLADVLEHERTLRDETEWGRFDPDYCYATLSKIVESTGLDLADCRSTVIGGSTTSCGILNTLRQRFEVSPRLLTLLHRGHGHGGHLKMLRKAIGHGRRIRVGTYSEKSVIQAIADSDIVFLGVDRKEPILDAEQIRNCRDFTARPLTIIDFNMFSSTSGMDRLGGVRLYQAQDLEAAVAEFAAQMCGSEQFARAVQAAESWIIQRLPVSEAAASVDRHSQSGDSVLREASEPVRTPEARLETQLAEAPTTRGDNGRAMVQSAVCRSDRPMESKDNGDNGVNLDVFRKYAGLSLPRHVSYPMPSWWQEIDEGQAEAMLADSQRHEPVRDLSLYLHVPFCEAQCKFCACNRITLRKAAPGAAQRVERYVQAMEHEIRGLGQALRDGRRVQQIHWGGGSPTYLSEALIQRLCRTIGESFTIAPEAEIAMEIDPRHAPRPFLEALRQAGFNRVSMGVQDFDPQVQKHICRNQPFGLVRETAAACRDLGFDSVNFDLIYGLPYQTMASVNETIRRTIELSPDRVAFYHYAQIPEKIATQRGMHHDKMPDSETKLKMFLSAADLFQDAGYAFIGLDHFARPDEALARALRDKTLQRTFQGMTTGGGLDLLGIGPTSISHLLGVGFIQNAHSTDDYISSMEAGRSAARKGKRFTDDDLIRQAVMTQLYCSAEVSPRDIQDRFGIDFADYFADELDAMRELQRDGLVEVDTDNTIRITHPLGRVLMRTVAAPFDAYLDKDAYRVGDQHMFSANA